MGSFEEIQLNSLQSIKNKIILTPTNVSHLIILNVGKQPFEKSNKIAKNKSLIPPSFPSGVQTFWLFLIYYMKNNSSILAECNYENNFVACVSKENIFGTQFHPEKSDKDGLKLIENFISL